MTWSNPHALTALVALAALSLTTTELSAQEEANTSPLTFVVAPPILPPGAMIALVSGNPAAPGRSTIELLMPDGYRMPPHYHPTDEFVQVKRGVLLVGMGDKFDAKQTMALAVGDTLRAPAGFHHFSIAKGETLVRVTFEGPYTITYVNANDAPKRAAFPYRY